MKRITMCSLLTSVLVLFCSKANLSAQNVSGPTEGILPFETAAGGTYDHINLANLNINIQAVFRSKAGTPNLPFTYSFGANELGVPGPWYQGPGGSAGLGASSPSHGVLCSDGVTHTTEMRRWTVVDSQGNRHVLPNLAVDSNGCLDGKVGTDATTDGSGITVKADWSSGSLAVSVWDRSGNSNVDPNGNAITATWNGSAWVYTDTLGQTALTFTPAANSTWTYQWNNSLGTL